MWDVRAAKPVRIWMQPRNFGRISCLTFSEDGIVMAIGSDKGNAARMDMRTGQAVKYFNTFAGPIWALGYEDNDMIAGGDFGLCRRIPRTDFARRRIPYPPVPARRAPTVLDGSSAPTHSYDRSSVPQLRPPAPELPRPPVQNLSVNSHTTVKIIGVSVQRDGSLRWSGVSKEPHLPESHPFGFAAVRNAGFTETAKHRTIGEKQLTEENLRTDRKRTASPAAFASPAFSPALPSQGIPPFSPFSPSPSFAHPAPKKAKSPD